MTTKFNRDEFTEVRFSFEEASSASEVDGENVIAKISGEFFVPDGTSRNKRYYPRSLWEKVLSKPEIVKKLDDRRMLGTIGHKQEIDDDAIANGKISHITTKLFIDERGKGRGEALILGTSAGKAFNTLARAGAKFFVSSRATGSFKGEYNGMPIVNEKDYDLSGFDIVLDPGFLEANPQLAESYSSLMNSNNTGEDDMSKELSERLMEEKLTLQAKLSEALEDLSEANGKVAIIEKENNDLQESFTSLTKENETLKESKASLEKTVSEYKELGTVEEISKVFTESVATATAIKEIGDFKSIKESMTELAKIKESLVELGSTAEIKEALLLSREKIKEYKELGEPKDIKKVFENVAKIRENKIQEDRQASIAALSKEFGLPEATISMLAGKIANVEEMKVLLLDVLEKFEKKEEQTNYTRTLFESGTKPKEDKDNTISELPRTTSTSLMESFK